MTTHRNGLAMKHHVASCLATACLAAACLAAVRLFALAAASAALPADEVQARLNQLG